MGRTSSVKRLDPQARKFLEKLMREDRHTLDELLTAVRTKFPDAQVSRSSIHRHRAGYEELVKGMREQQAIASLVVSELGENPDDKAGALMVQSITTLTTHAALGAQVDEDVTIDDVRKLARAAKDVLAARKVSREERRAIEKEAREALLAEQEQRLEEMRGSDGMSEQLENRIRGILLGKA